MPSSVMDRPSPFIVAKNMAPLRTRQAAIAQCKRQIVQCGRHMATAQDYTEVPFWLEVVDHLENTNFD